MGAVRAVLRHTRYSKGAESDPMSGDFNPEQKRDLEGFAAGTRWMRCDLRSKAR